MMMPTLFISHGAPTLALMPESPFVQSWKKAFQSLTEKPRAILMISGHWETHQPTVLATPQPKTVHDFGGFPKPLYQLQYPAQGAPDIAEEIAAHLQHAGWAAQKDMARGLDHGAWMPLLHMVPQAGIPVLQLSVLYQKDAKSHYQLGAALTSLRERGVLIVGSGSLTHNLWDLYATQSPQEGHPYVFEFQAWFKKTLLENNVQALLNWSTRAPHAQRAHPTPEHLMPFFVALGAAGDNPTVHYDQVGVDLGGIVMDTILFGV